MQPIIYKMRLDCAKPGNQASIYVKQGDIQSRQISLYLYNNSEPYYIDEDVTVVLRAEKPDETLVFTDCEVDGNVVRHNLVPQMMTAVGTVNCELTIYDADMGVLFSPKFSVYVENPFYPDQRIESTDDFSALTTAMAQANEFKTRWTNAWASARPGAIPDAKVWLDIQGVNFDFTLPHGLEVLGLYPSLEALEADVENPSTGDAYGVGEQAPYELYLWNESEWVAIGPLNGAGGGVPEGGTLGQVIIKQSDEAYDASWENSESILVGREVTGPSGSGAGGLLLPKVMDGSAYTRMQIFGRSIQDATPSADDPQEIKSVVVQNIVTSNANRWPPYVTDKTTYFPIPDESGLYYPPAPAASVTVRGIHVPEGVRYNHIDGDGNRWSCDTYDPVSGEYRIRVGYYELTGEEWDGYYQFQSSPVNMLVFNYVPGRSGWSGSDYAVCSHFDRYGSYSDLEAGDANFHVRGASDETSRVYFATPVGITSKESAIAWIASEYSNGTPVSIAFVLSEDVVETMPIPVPMFDDWEHTVPRIYASDRYLLLCDDNDSLSLGTDVIVEYNNLPYTDKATWLKVRDLIDETGASKQDFITASGILKGDGAGGVSAAVSGTDYQGPVTASGILKGDGAGNISAATSGTDYQPGIGAANGVLKGDGVGNISAASAGTDYIAPPASVTGTGAITVTLADNKEYSYTDVTSIAITAANVSCHGFIVFAGSTPSPAPSVSGYSGTLAGDDITEAAASETWEFSCEHGFLVFKNWGVVV